MNTPCSQGTFRCCNAPGGNTSREESQPFRAAAVMRPVESPGQRVGNMDDERLIVEVQQHEVIYIPNHPFYKGNGRKDKTWHLIAVVVGVEGEYIRFRIIA